MVFVEGDPTTTLDDRWVSRPITSVGAATCPTSGNQAWSFQTSFAVTSPSNDPVTNAQITVGSPVRTFEVMEYQLYSDASGKYYLGAVSVSNSAAVQPVLGPLSSDGFRLTYYDSAGTSISTPTSTLPDRQKVRAIQVTLVGVSTQAVTASGYGTQQQAVDSVVTLVQLRNAVHR